MMGLLLIVLVTDTLEEKQEKDEARKSYHPLCQDKLRTKMQLCVAWNSENLEVSTVKFWRLCRRCVGCHHTKCDHRCNKP